MSIGSLAVKAPDTITSWSLDVQGLSDMTCLNSEAFSITASGIATTVAECLASM